MTARYERTPHVKSDMRSRMTCPVCGKKRAKEYMYVVPQKIQRRDFQGVPYTTYEFICIRCKRERSR